MPGNASCDITDRLSLRLERATCSEIPIGEGTRLTVSGRCRSDRDSDAETVRLSLVVDGHSRGDQVTVPPGDSSFSLDTEVLEIRLNSDGTNHMRLSIEAQTDDGRGGFHGNIVDVILLYG